MAVDIFLKIDGAKGESQDDKHKDEIDVLAWSWGMSQSGTYHVGSGGGSGKANFQDISVTKYIDKSSPILMKFCAMGDHFKSADLVVRKAGGKKPVEYISIHMEPVLITSVSTGGSGGEDRLTENVSLNFREFKLKYIEQTKEGGEGAKPDFNFNIATNKDS